MRGRRRPRSTRSSSSGSVLKAGCMKSRNSPASTRRKSSAPGGGSTEVSSKARVSRADRCSVGHTNSCPPCAQMNCAAYAVAVTRMDTPATRIDTPASRRGRCWPGDPGLRARPVRTQASDGHPVPVDGDPRAPSAPEPDRQLRRRLADRGVQHDLVAACLKLLEPGQPAGSLGGRIDDPDRPAAAAPDLAGPDIQAAASLAYERGGGGRRHGLQGSATGRCRVRGRGLVTKARDVVVRGCQLRTLPHTSPCRQAARYALPTACSSASMAASSSGVPWTFGPRNHFLAEARYHPPAPNSTTAVVI